MIVFKIVGLAIISSILIIIIKQKIPEIAFLLSLVTGLFILILIISQVGEVVRLIKKLVEKAGIDIMYFNTIMKIVGIAYIGEFGAEITRDAGENALATKIEMAVKIIILFLAIPIMISLIETIIELIPRF